MAFDVPLQRGMIAILILTIATIPLYHVFHPEYERPMRLRMAPRGTLFKIRTLVAAGGPFTALALTLLLFAGWGSWVWVVSVSGLMLLMAFSYLLAHPVLRTGIQIVLTAAAFSTQWMNQWIGLC
jgi:fatty acid desaturase